MKPRTSIALLLGLFLASGIVGLGLSASAHTASDWYGKKWGNGNLTPKWRFADDVPKTCCYRDRIQNGKAEWNQLGEPMSFDFAAGQPDFPAFPFLSCPKLSDGSANKEKNAMHWSYLDGKFGFAGETYVCSFYDVNEGNPDYIANFQMRFDSGESWYTGTGTPSCPNVDSCQTDLWSVATHEFGHATGRTKGGDGLGHFGENWSVCADVADKHSMCPWDFANYTRGRSLELHDKDSFRSAY